MTIQLMQQRTVIIYGGQYNLQLEEWGEAVMSMT